MAITIGTSPGDLSSVHDALWHVVSSDNSGTTDFKYVFDVWVNGVQKIRVKQFPEPSNGKGYFDAGPVVRNCMVYDWFEPTQGFIDYTTDNEMPVTYAIRIGEEVSSITTTNLASGEVTAYNWTPNLFRRRNEGLWDMRYEWLTNRPLSAKVALGENLFIPFFGWPGVNGCTLELYNHSNQLVDTRVESESHANFAQLNIGPSKLSSYFSTTIDESIKYYEIYFQSGVTNYPRFRVYLTCNPKYTCYPVHFMNRWGMYDTLRFDLVSKLNMDIQRKGFEQRDFKFNGGAVDYIRADNIYYESKVNHSNAANWSYKLTADAPSDEEWDWISDLFVSPHIILEIDGYYYPVTIKATSYEYSRHVFNRLKPLEVEFEFNTTRYSQLR